MEVFHGMHIKQIKPFSNKRAKKNNKETENMKFEFKHERNLVDGSE